MAEIVDLNICLCVGDGDTLVKDNSAIKAVVGTYDGFVTIDMGNNYGKQTYIISKQFARDLAKALEEKAK